MLTKTCDSTTLTPDKFDLATLTVVDGKVNPTFALFLGLFLALVLSLALALALALTLALALALALTLTLALALSRSVLQTVLWVDEVGVACDLSSLVHAQVHELHLKLHLSCT